MLWVTMCHRYTKLYLLLSIIHNRTCKLLMMPDLHHATAGTSILNPTIKCILRRLDLLPLTGMLTAIVQHVGTRLRGCGRLRNTILCFTCRCFCLQHYWEIYHSEKSHPKYLSRGRQLIAHAQQLQRHTRDGPHACMFVPPSVPLRHAFLVQGDVGPVGNLLEEVHEAIAEIVKVCTSYWERLGLLGFWKETLPIGRSWSEGQISKRKGRHVPRPHAKSVVTAQSHPER